MVSIWQISCVTRQKLGNLRSQTGNKLSDKVAQLCCASDIGLRLLKTNCYASEAVFSQISPPHLNEPLITHTATG